MHELLRGRTEEFAEKLKFRIRASLQRCLSSSKPYAPLGAGHRKPGLSANCLAAEGDCRHTKSFSAHRDSLDSRLQRRSPKKTLTKDARLKKAPHLCGAVYCNRRSYLPVPVRLEVCGLLLALSATFNFPVLVPTAVGLNTTLMVQLVLAARLAPQVVVETLKSPVVELTMLSSVTLWLFLSVNVFGRLVVPTVWAAYVALLGVNVTGAMPVPDSGTVCGLFAALSVIVMLPVRAPSWVGVKVTLMMQFAPAASVLPQGFVLATGAKSPLTTMLLMFSVALPVFVIVTLLAVVVVPTTVLPNTSDVGDSVTTGPPPPPQPVKANDPM